MAGRFPLSQNDVPLFPLTTVLFPGGPLPLRVFEPRYLDMVSRCMREQRPFGVLLLSGGAEVGGQVVVRTAGVGTLATIADFYQGADGLLGITACGGQRFRLLGMRRQADGLNLGDIEMLEPEAEVSLPQRFALMAELLRTVVDDLGKLYEAVSKRYDDAGWVGFRFAEILPLTNAQKQHCLELMDPIARLEFLQPVLRQIRDQQTQ
jgi:Lon protease-like protein